MVTEKAILKILGERNALLLFGIRPKPTKTTEVILASDGKILSFMNSKLNNQ